MSAISLKSITGITSITTPAGADNQLTLHTNNTTERVKIDVAGNVHINNQLAVAGVSTLGSGASGQVRLDYQGNQRLKTHTWGVEVSGALSANNIVATAANSSFAGASFTGDITCTSDLTLDSTNTDYPRITLHSNATGIRKYAIINGQGWNQDALLIYDIDADNTRLTIEPNGLGINRGANSISHGLDVGGSAIIRGNTETTGDITISSVAPTINLTETNGDPDYRIFCNGGIFNIVDVNNNVNRIEINSNRTTINNPTLINNNILYVLDTITHWGDDNTKIRFPSNDQISFEANGDQRLRIYDDGYVIIGSTSKSSTTGAGGLDIQGNSTNCIIEMGNPFPNFSGGIVPEFRITATNSSHTVDFESVWGGDNGLHKHLSFAGGVTSIHKGINDDEVARFTSNGNLLIGKTSSGGKAIEIYQGSYAALRIQNSSTGTGSSDGILIEAAGSDALFWNYESANIRFGTSGSEKVRITSTGYVGINQSSPQTGLHVNQDWVSSYGSISAEGSANALVGLGLRSNGNYRGSLIWRDGSSGNYLDISTYGGAYPILFRPNGTERLRIASDGDVTITASGDPTLTVTGSGHAQLTLTNTSGADHTGVNFGDSDDHNAGMIQYSNSNNAMQFHTNGAEKLRITSAGQLLLGETSAHDTYTAVQFRKDVDNQARFIFRNNSTAGSSRVRLDIMTQNRAGNTNVFSGIEKYQSGGMNIINGENTNEYSDIGFWSNGYRSLRLRNGNYSTDVAHFYAYWGTSNGIHMEQGGPQSGTHKAIRFTTSHYGGERGYIGVTLGGTSYNSSSDYRQKQDVVDLTGAIDRVKSFKPRRFKWKDDPTYTVDGFLAHEAQTVVPESVVGDKDAVDKNGDPEYQVIDQSKLVPLLTAALQEAITEIETLKTKVAALEGS